MRELLGSPVVVLCLSLGFTLSYEARITETLPRPELIKLMLQNINGLSMDGVIREGVPIINHTLAKGEFSCVILEVLFENL